MAPLLSLLLAALWLSAVHLPYATVHAGRGMVWHGGTLGVHEEANFDLEEDQSIENVFRAKDSQEACFQPPRTVSFAKPQDGAPQMMDIQVHALSIMHACMMPSLWLQSQRRWQPAMACQWYT
jgi:hypothetical protein